MTTISSSFLVLTINCSEVNALGARMDIVNVKNAEETYRSWHSDFLIEEFLQKRGSAEVAEVLRTELENRKITLETIQKIVKENKLDEFPDGLTYADLALRANRVMAFFIDFFYFLCAYAFASIITWAFNLDNANSALIYLLLWVYLLGRDALPNGQSLGAKSMQLKVVCLRTGENCKAWQSFVRNIVLYIPILNIADLLWTGRLNRQRIGDLFAGTIVIDVRA